jgi:mono/diheme cytochrome c family protein
LGLSDDAAEQLIEYECADGFAGVLPAAKVTDTRAAAARAFLAVEDPARPWPALPGPARTDPGPFYLVWTDPQKSAITQEQWPFQVVRLSLIPKLAQSYPAMVPHRKGAAVDRGLRVFLANCFSCHTVNGVGPSHLGPDLNTPASPVEYLQAWALRRLVRDPQSLRKWQEGRMPAFSAEVLLDASVADLIAYLGELSAERSQTP